MENHRTETDHSIHNHQRLIQNNISFQNAVNSRPNQISITITNNIHVNHYGQILPSNATNHPTNVNNGNIIVNSVEQESQANNHEITDNETDQDDDNENNDIEYFTPPIRNKDKDDHS